MAHVARLRKVGGSVMLAIPPALLDSLDLRPGGSVGMTVEGGRLMIDPNPTPRYGLEELLARCDPQAEDGDRAWRDAPATGRELL
jgi:antitoxin ChpS